MVNLMAKAANESISEENAKKLVQARAVIEKTSKEVVIDLIIIAEESPYSVLVALNDIKASKALQKNGYALSVQTLLTWLETDHESYKNALTTLSTTEAGYDVEKGSKKIWKLIEAHTTLASSRHIGLTLLKVAPIVKA